MAADEVNESNCGVCSKVVKNNDNAIICDGLCANWYHIKCVKISSIDYQKIQDLGSKIKWYCDTCNLKVKNAISNLNCTSDSISIADNGEPLRLNVILDELNKISENYLHLCKRVEIVENFQTVTQKPIPTGLQDVTQIDKPLQVKHKLSVANNNCDGVQCELNSSVSCNKEKSDIITCDNSSKILPSDKPTAEKDLTPTKFTCVPVSTEKTSSQLLFSQVAAIATSGVARVNKQPTQPVKRNVLRTVNKRKSLFISRLHPEVKEEDLTTYLSASGFESSEFECVKLKSRSAVNAFGDLEVQPVRGDSHEYGTHNRLRLDLPYCRLGRMQSSVVYLPGKIINKLPISVRSLPVAALKQRLEHFLQENPFYSLNKFFECDSALFIEVLETG
ncbi:uncharacterized protein LOC111053697 [Nilaparvata lugens]|uniref:uncharacterized protein LOC111053697 n=1 Tax=Nilaparvata lugens TaxID=108931 RepID=UPI00193E5CCC|nr:uncharacterized protein LOC111053697 [Nilaparvata lugens]